MRPGRRLGHKRPLRQLPAGDRVADRPQTQGHWNGPQLTDGQRLGALESLEEAPEGLGLDAAVGVADEGRADMDLDGHLQAANLGQRSADLPIEQERELC